jgi:hypothetical protein
MYQRYPLGVGEGFLAWRGTHNFNDFQ